MLERVALSVSCALVIGAVAAFALRVVVMGMIASAGRRFSAAQRHRMLTAAFFMAALVYIALFARLLSGAEITAQTTSLLLSNTARVPSAAVMLLARAAALLALALASAWSCIVVVRFSHMIQRVVITNRIRNACGVFDALASHSLSLAAVARVAGRMHVAPPGVLISTSELVPAIIGTWSPTLVLPARMETMMTPEQADLIIAHELAHIIRHDSIINTAQTCVENLFSLCPSMRAMSRCCRAERELAADALAAQTFGAPLVLARALERLETARARQPATLAVAADDGPLLRRIAALADAQRTIVDTQRTTRDRTAILSSPVRHRFDHARFIAANTVVAIAAVANIAAVPGSIVDDTLRLTAPAAAYQQDIQASDDAGPFTLRVVGYRAVAATFAGRSFPATHIRQRGDAVRFIGNDGTTLLAVRLNPTGGMTWNSR